MELSAEEIRHIMERRSMVSFTQPEQSTPQVPPPTATLTPLEWEWVQLHRVAQQAKLTGGSVVSSLQDPMQQMNAVAVVVLRSMRDEVDALRPADISDALIEVQKISRRWLTILGADGPTQEDRPEGSGSR